MTSRTPRRHRRLALMAAGTAAAMVLLPGAASAQVVNTEQQFTGAPALGAVVLTDRGQSGGGGRRDVVEADVTLPHELVVR